MRRKYKQIQREILRTLDKQGTMTANAVAKEIKAKLSTAERHLEWLMRYTNTVETVFIKPKWKGYKLKIK